MTRSSMVQIRVSPREYRWWVAVAGQADVTLSELVRGAVRAWVTSFLGEGGSDPKGGKATHALAGNEACKTSGRNQQQA